MFVANGLLSSSSSQVHPPKDVVPLPTKLKFVPNGLLSTLGTTKSTTSHDTEMPVQSSTSKSLSFVRNGLLSSHPSNPVIVNAVLPCADSPCAMDPNTQTDTQSSLDDDLPPASEAFTPRADSPCAMNPNTQTDTQSSLDDDLPPVSEAFALPSHLLSGPNVTTSIPHIPRVTVRATTNDGKTIYLRKKKKLGSSEMATTSTQRMGNLLEVPIHRLMDELSAATAENLQRIDQNPQPQTPNISLVEDTLWVDKYRPQKFTDLVGNERVARDAMAWVKQWDWCVFGKARGKKRIRDEENVNLDEYRRPEEKILLLSGPPGLGKTTLAYVVARQAGYEVMEINASDARSGSVVDDRIRPALESGSAVGSTRPVLLVIDEIDGATGTGENSNTFIHKLVQLIHSKQRRKQRTGQVRDAHIKRPILRPIICICNDLNASSLTKLRPHARQIRFNRPADIHIVKRLKEICQIEGLKADSRALSTLVSAAKGDLRGCLNTLQFIKARGEDVTEIIVRKANYGMKEADATVISVINNLFNPLSRKRVKDLGLSDEEEARYVLRLSQDIEGSGRDNSIASGCFGHYATLRQHDANLSRHERANEWLATFDLFSSAMYSDGDFVLNQYLPYTLVPFYPLFQERGGDRVERNQADWDNLQLTRSNEEIYKSLSRCLQNATVRHGGDFRHLVSTPILQLEFVPFINRIISPPLRPVNSQVIRPSEKALMVRLVDIMTSLELRFVQERAEDGQLSYRLDPPIDVFVTYDGKRPTDIAVSRYAVRHLVSAEINAKLIARDTEFVEKGKRGKHDFFGKSAGSRVEEDGDTTHPNKRPKLDCQDVADKPPTDFFGRLITIPSASTSKAAARKNVAKKYRVTYRYLEGNSAAVRRPIKVNTFF